MKKICFLFLLFISFLYPFAQDTISPVIADSINGQLQDTLINSDSLLIVNQPRSNGYFQKLSDLLGKNQLLNSKAQSEVMVMIPRNYQSKDILFYLIFTVLLFFGLLKVFYSRYLNNMFRVFFNTSLRQSQLTDQLLQAKLPSLFFNIFFVITGGLYIYLLLFYLGYITSLNDYKVLVLCMLGVLSIYVVKYIVLKFTGWISGYKNAADIYIFIVFLINKIIAIVLIPIILIMAFSDKSLVKPVVLLSFILIALMLIMRFLRSYSILQNKVKVQRFHFFLYIIGIEILPLLVIYKASVDLLTNNL